MGLIKGLHHVHLKCMESQVEEVLHFYVDVLGLKLLDKRSDCAILDSGNGIVEIFWDADRLLGQGDIRHFAFFVEDVDACIQTVEQAGYRIKEYPIDVVFALGRPAPARIAFCYGVLGEEVEFFQLRDEDEKEGKESE